MKAHKPKNVVDEINKFLVEQKHFHCAVLASIGLRNADSKKAEGQALYQ